MAAFFRIENSHSGGEVMFLLKRAVEGLNGYFLKIALLFTVLMMFVTVADVLMRFFA
ncbi:MAG: hypothetical protein ACOX1I_05695 [Dethiobacteria bacterium]